jgi:hypothetical protein
MTFNDRVQAIAKKGFTARQAQFLTTVILHAGVCVPRQYARFCGIVYGAKTRKFFAKLVRSVTPRCTTAGTIVRKSIISISALFTRRSARRTAGYGNL